MGDCAGARAWFDIEVDEGNEPVVVRLIGDVDVACAAQLHYHLRRFAEHKHAIVLDLTAATHFGSAAQAVVHDARMWGIRVDVRGSRGQFETE